MSHIIGLLLARRISSFLTQKKLQWMIPWRREKVIHPRVSPTLFRCPSFSCNIMHSSYGACMCAINGSKQLVGVPGIITNFTNNLTIHLSTTIHLSMIIHLSTTIFFLTTIHFKIYQNAMSFLQDEIKIHHHPLINGA